MADGHGERIARVEEQLAALDRLMRTEFDARDRAVHVQATEIERVRSQQNEWRQTVTDLTADKVERRAWQERNSAVDEKFEQRARAVDDKIEQLRGEIVHLRTSRDENAGKGLGQAQLIAFIVAALGIVTSVIVFTR